MKRHALTLLALVILAIAGWAYSINYKTMTALDGVSALRAQIAKERETLQVLRVEWAYLNAPERLASLVARHSDALGLAPLDPAHLGDVDAIPFPAGSGREDETEQGLPRFAMPVPAARPADWRRE